MSEQSDPKPGTPSRLDKATALKAFQAQAYIQSLMARTGMDVDELFAAAIALYDKARREIDDMDSIGPIFERPNGDRIVVDILGH